MGCGSILRGLTFTFLALVSTIGLASVSHAADVDGDGVSASLDCNDADPFVWSVASEVTGLSVDADRKTFRWSPPGTPGGVSVSYDLLRSTNPADFSTDGVSSCAQVDDDAPVAVDATIPAPGQVFFYLPRAVNSCGEGSLGSGPGQSTRAGRSCHGCAGGCDDGNACTTDSCVAGACQHAPAVPLIAHGPKTATACAGGAASFEIRDGGRPPVHYAWTVNGQPAGTDSSVLNIPAVAAAQDGAIVACTVSDACGGSSTAQATLFVLPTPDACSGGNNGFEAAGGATFPPNDPNPASAPTDVNVGTVIPATGEYRLDETDLVLPGRGIDFTWTRVYRSRAQRLGPLGYNWTHGYETSVAVDPDDATRRLVLRPDGSIDRYTAAGACWQAAGRFDQLCMLGDGRYELTAPDGTVARFRALTSSAAPGRLEQLADRNGNALTLAFDSSGLLTSITDTLGRVHTLWYDDNGRLGRLVLSTGRAVDYLYYAAGSRDGAVFDLASATLPATPATPDGGKIGYTYSVDSTDSRLAHNLLTRTDERGVVVVDTAYTAARGESDPAKDRVTRQEFPDGTSIAYAYTAVTPGPSNNGAVTTTTIRDRIGNVRTLFYDGQSRLVLDRVSSGRAPDKSKPSAGSYNAPGASLRPEDPPVWETRHSYNPDGLRTSTVHPEGNDEQLTYDEANPSRRQQGNLLQMVRNPGPRGADQANLTESWTYGTPFGGAAFWTSYTDPKGLTVQRTFDGNGNVFSRTEPTVTEGVFGGGSLTVQETWSYNAAGQVSGHVAPNGRTDTFTYHDSGPQAGYPASAVIDQGNRNLTTSYDWDGDGNLVAETDPLGATTQYAYDGQNRLIRTQAAAPFNYITLIQRDEAGRPTEVARQNIDANGALQPHAWIVSRSSYDALGRLVSEQREWDDVGLVGALTHYDANGNVTKVESAAARAGDPTGRVVVTLHDTRNLPWKTTQGFGTASATTDETVYDGNGNVTHLRHALEGPGGPRETTTTYDGFDRKTSVVDPLGVAATKEYDATGLPVAEEIKAPSAGPSGAAPRGAAKFGGTVFSRRSVPHGASLFGETVFSRTTAYNELRLAYSTAVAHFGQGNVPVGDGLQTTLNFFDTMRNNVGTTKDNGAQTVSTFTNTKQLTSRTDALANQTTFVNDAAGHVVSSTATEISALGSAPANFTSSANYDLLGRTTSQTDSCGDTTQNFYDSRGNMTKTIDANGNVVLYTYDTRDQLVRTDATMTSDGTGGGAPIGTVTTRQEFDESGRLTKKTDANGNVTTFNYDSLDRKVQTVFADGTRETDEYDVYGDLVRSTDANGTVVTMSYDADGRVVARQIARAPGIEGATFENYEYDSLGNVTRAENDHSVVSLVYDSLGNVLSETSIVDGNTVTTSASYDGLGNRLTLTYPSGKTVNQSHDALQRVVGIDDGTNLATYSWFGPGTRRERIAFGNASSVNYAFDACGRVTRMTHIDGGTGLPFEDREYGWDRASHVTSHDDLLASTAHDLEYDSLYRLSRSVKPSETVDYALDNVGNRTSVSGGHAAGSYNLGPASMNRYASTPADTRAYDDAGNLRQIAAGATNRQIAFDYRGRVTRVSGVADATTFRYDALGRRLSKEVTSGDTPTHTYFRNFGSDIVESRYEDPTAGSYRVVDYVHGPGTDEVAQAVEVDDSDGGLEKYWLHADLNANVIALTDASGSQIEHYNYTDYGQPTVLPVLRGQLCSCSKDYKPVTCNGVEYNNACLASCAGCGSDQVGRNAFLFQGRPYDSETGLYDFRNRSYDPTAGRFASRDPLGVWGDPGELGVGDAFEGNGPWNGRDPFGNFIRSQPTALDLAQCKRNCDYKYRGSVGWCGTDYASCQADCDNMFSHLQVAQPLDLSKLNVRVNPWSRYENVQVAQSLDLSSLINIPGPRPPTPEPPDCYPCACGDPTCNPFPTPPLGPKPRRPIDPTIHLTDPGIPPIYNHKPNFGSIVLVDPSAYPPIYHRPPIDWSKIQLIDPPPPTAFDLCIDHCSTDQKPVFPDPEELNAACTAWCTGGGGSVGHKLGAPVGPLLGTSDKLCPGSAHCPYRYPEAASK